MDITISTEKHMAMSELLKRYAALSHGVYLEIAKEKTWQHTRPGMG